MEAGEYGLTRGTCFVARRLEVVAVAGLLGISWCALGAAGFILFCFVFVRFCFFFERARPAASMRTPCLMYLSTSTGVRTGCHYLIYLSVSVSVCVTFVVFTDCESCTMPIFTNPGSMEAAECGPKRGTCFLACRLEVVTVAGLLWISWCVLDGAIFFLFFFSRFFFFFERTRPAASMRPPLASFTSLLVMRQVRGSEATEAVFYL